MKSLNDPVTVSGSHICRHMRSFYEKEEDAPGSIAVLARRIDRAQSRKSGNLLFGKGELPMKADPEVQPEAYANSEVYKWIV